jgi:hypothetical protein
MTGMALRAFSESRKYKKSKEIRKAGELLASRFFKRDPYSDRNTPEYWIKFPFPFWFTDLLSALDSLSKLDFDAREPQIKKALAWFLSIIRAKMESGGG